MSSSSVRERRYSDLYLVGHETHSKEDELLAQVSADKEFIANMIATGEMLNDLYFVRPCSMNEVYENIKDIPKVMDFMYKGKVQKARLIKHTACMCYLMFLDDKFLCFRIEKVRESARLSKKGDLIVIT